MNEKSIIIRKAKESDIDIIYRWGMNNWQLWSDENNKFYDKKSLLKMLHSDSCLMLIATDDGRPVGMFISFDLVTWAMFDTLYVEPTHRRRGVAKKLLAAAQTEFSVRGISEFDSVVHIDNAESLAFHEKNGFKKTQKFWWMMKKTP
jgi:ribosomal protein S18 acetylase RimI-like enzyme